MAGKFQKPFIFFSAAAVLMMITVCEADAQELNCSVTVNDRQISGASYDYISELPAALGSYINGFRWTGDSFEEHERIQCTIQVVLTGVDSNFNFTAEAVFSMRRPIYNSNQQSLTIVLNDNNWRFNYPRNKNLLHDDLQFDDLTSFIDFYMNVLLGYDYDTFSELGGTPFFNRALAIFELGQGTGAQGWGRSIGAQRNRFGLITDLTNPAYEEFRRAIYRYHRLGIDQFTIDADIARGQILTALEMIRENKRVTTNNYLFDLFFSAKYSEIVGLFAEGQRGIRNEAFNLLRETDPAHTSQYQRLQ
ncbi:MAG: DUF4835 family protein [Balneolaceae bacterium]|nr:MAG: DUF4835 family protein [Balneolaceae bacterium]